jgi:hypothetical protein
MGLSLRRSAGFYASARKPLANPNHLVVLGPLFAGEASHPQGLASTHIFLSVVALAFMPALDRESAQRQRRLAVHVKTMKRVRREATGAIYWFFRNLHPR